MLIISGFIAPGQIPDFEFANILPWVGIGLAVFIFVLGMKTTLSNYFGRQKGHKIALKVLGEMENTDKEIQTWERKMKSWEFGDWFNVIFLLIVTGFLFWFGMNHAEKISLYIPTAYIQYAIYIIAIITPIWGVVTMRKSKTEECKGKISNLKGLQNANVPKI
ncbi:hypothetical protein HC823_02270 [Candidatus Gracilibacteria bacterium]|nr:hypothetical protein [Candidatus Gracilibacteria bacterium]